MSNTPRFFCEHQMGVNPCPQCHTGGAAPFGTQTDKLTLQVMVSTLRQAETTITNARSLVLEMRRLLLQHAPIADAEVIAALALSYELVGD